MVDRKTTINIWYIVAALAGFALIQGFYQSSKQYTTVPYSRVCGVLSLRHFGLARWCSLSLGGWWPRIRSGDLPGLAGGAGATAGFWRSTAGCGFDRDNWTLKPRRIRKL